MWKPYLQVVAAEAGHALHVLDRFHITMHLNQAVDQVRRGESTRLRAAGKAERLKHMRWTLLRRGSRVRGRARQKLQALLASKPGFPRLHQWLTDGNPVSSFYQLQLICNVIYTIYVNIIANELLQGTMDLSGTVD